MNHTATYSPEDDKLRLYPSERLPADVYARVKDAGFSWAPKQDCFFATWTPDREDLSAELAGEIEDEDKSLMDRAEERADRFDGYRENRTADGARAQEAVEAIAGGIPLGQPIIVGHHSEARARRAADRIQSGMRAAIRAFETADYWKHRAAAAIRAAKYKERPDVRARRIKGIEADRRRAERGLEHCQKALQLWSRDLTHETAEKIAGSTPWGDFHCPRKAGDRPDWEQLPSAYAALSGSYPTLYAPRTVEEVLDAGRAAYPPRIANWQRWIAHYDNRLAYERAMLAESGGTVADRTGPQVGGAVRCWAGRGRWLWIQRVNRVSVTILDNWGNGGANFTRTIAFDKLSGVMTPEQVAEAREAGRVFETPDKTGFALAGDAKPEPQPKAPEDRPAEA